MIDKLTTPLHKSDQLTNSSTNLENELARVNKEIYERNVELSIHNRTLSILGKIYEIINTSLGLSQTAEQLIDAIVKELKFQKGFIALVNNKTKTLSVTAVSDPNPAEKNFLKKHKHPFWNLKIPLNNKDNLCVASAIHNQQRMTNVLYDILVPVVLEKEAEEIATKLNIQTTVLYPIVFGGRPFGVLGLCMDKHVGDLTRFERETLKELIDLVAIALERAKIYADLKIANTKLKELDILKDEFVSIASHELRTPMTAIKSYLWMALNKSPQKLNETLKKYLDISYISTERLIRLVNEMLTVSRIERNKIELKKEVIDIYDTVKQVYDELVITAIEKKIHLALNKPVENLFINGDKDRLREVFQNLVGNALKFTQSSGKISIEISSHGSNVAVAVADTGTGIQPKDMDKLFQKFSKLEYSYVSHSDQPGSGLGLYISKQIISLHQGDIRVQSILGKGTTFTVMLPKNRKESVTKND